MPLSDDAKKRVRVAVGSPENSDEVVERLDRAAADVADIADTSTATAEDVGDKVNEMLAAMRAAGLME